MGRGRGAALQMAIAQSTSVNEATSFSEADEKKKKERKLKKMLRQVKSSGSSICSDMLAWCCRSWSWRKRKRKV